MNNILITGASSDIGCELMRHLDNKNLTIYAHFNKSIKIIDALQKELYSTIVPLQADLSTSNQVQNLIKEIEACDIENIVHIASPDFENIRFRKLNWADFDIQIQVGLRSITEILIPLLPKMAKQKKGKIVFLLSSCTINVPPMALAHYVTMKYGLLGLMKSLASEYNRYGININALSPSMIETKFIQRLPEKSIELAAEKHPLKKLASTSDIVPMIEFLLSDKSDYINGVNHPVTGGESF